LRVLGSDPLRRLVKAEASEAPLPLPLFCVAALRVHKTAHSKIAVTMEIYTEVPSAATREALRKLGQWLVN
jgi:hypothetical protein